MRYLIVIIVSILLNSYGFSCKTDSMVTWYLKLASLLNGYLCVRVDIGYVNIVYTRAMMLYRIASVAICTNSN